jgi:hypothetical protein
MLQVKSLQKKSKDFFQRIEEPCGHSPTDEVLTVGFFHQLEIVFWVAALACLELWQGRLVRVGLRGNNAGFAVGSMPLCISPTPSFLGKQMRELEFIESTPPSLPQQNRLPAF